jgi:sulfate transport system substrate-binding protein
MEYYHSMLAATLVAPGHDKVIPLEPEFIVPQDGAEKQDCENMAAKRWLAAHAQRYAALDPVYLGDDLFSRQPLCHAVLDTGARGATVSFVERGVGDVLLAWENEAFLALREFGKDKFEIVSPSVSILAEPPLSVVDAVADRKGTRAVAEAYVRYWYSKEGQEIAARNSYRPRDPEIAKEYENSFAKVELFTVGDVFGGWTKAQKEHFGEGGIFDQIYKN